MIRYALQCVAGHGFESWFRDSDAFDALSAAGQVTCPSCGGTDVRKAMMAPSVVTSRRKARVETAPAPVPAAPAPPRPAAVLDEQAAALRAAIRDMHRRVAETADNVGRGFAAEARAIHEGTAPSRSIYGEATRDEVVDLLEDGVPLLPLPPLPDEHH